MQTQWRESGAKYYFVATWAILVFLWIVEVLQYSYLIPPQAALLSKHGQNFSGIALAGINLYEFLVKDYFAVVMALMYGAACWVKVGAKKQPVLHKARVLLLGAFVLLTMVLEAGALASSMDALKGPWMN